MAPRILLLLLLVSGSALGAPKFARIFGEGMVLQQGKAVAVWGTGASPESRVEVVFGRHRVLAKAGAEGSWRAGLPALKASAVGRDLRLLVDGEEAGAIADVLVGEVWLAAGQSNMGFTVRGMLKGLPETASWVESADRPRIRYRRIADPVGDPAPADLREAAPWVRMSPDSVLGFSAVAAGFAREIEANRDYPVGIIDVSWGGKPIEPFIPRERFTTPLLKRIRDLAAAGDLEELAGLPGGVIIRNPEGHPAAIYEARILPVVPLALRGFLWYQAESNSGRGEDPRDYRHKMVALVEGWRTAWDSSDLPFLYVQLPSFEKAPGWIRMREEQRLALDLIPNSAMAVTIDIRSEGIHPPDKLPVGRRLALLARRQVYGEDELLATGPRYRDCAISGGEVKVTFDSIVGGLMVGDRPVGEPVKETPGEALRWFELAGEDGTWHGAEARIRGGSVLVTSAAVPVPVAVRYACHLEPQGGNLYNREGLPASPFCSDLELLPWEDLPTL